MAAESNLPYQQILEGLRDSADGGDSMMALLGSILGSNSLRPEEQMILEFLVSLQDDDESDGQVIDGEYKSVDDDYAEPQYSRRGISRNKIERLQEELADLREVNDTVAAALGSCQYCWGGDDECEMCEGYGSPGWRAPEPRLFKELVIPAVLRTRTLRQESRRNPDAPARRKPRTERSTNDSY